MEFDLKNHRGGDTQYLRDLVRKTGLTQRGAARVIGISERTMRRYCAGMFYPYVVQFAMEGLAERIGEDCRLSVYKPARLSRKTGYEDEN